MTTDDARAKDWDEIMRAMSSPEASDEDDVVNYCSVMKNARTVAELLHNVVPTLSPVETGAVPKGMNDFSAVRDRMTKVVSESRRLVRPRGASAGVETTREAPTLPRDESVPGATAASADAHG